MSEPTDKHDAPDTSRPCPACSSGYLLSGLSQCPNPRCQNHKGPLLHVRRDRPKVGGGNRPAIVAYRFSPFRTAPDVIGWRWVRA